MLSQFLWWRSRVCDIVKQLQCGPGPNSRLQSKSWVKSLYVYLDSIQKRRRGGKKGKIDFTVCFQSWISFIKARKCLLKNPQRKFLCTKQTNTNWVIEVLLVWFATNKQKPSGLAGMELVFLDSGHCGLCFFKALIRKHFPFPPSKP